MPDSFPLLSAAQHRRLDQLAEALAGLTPAMLMETASQQAAAAIQRDYPGTNRARVLVGPGRNGGDGMGVARWLSLAGWQVEWVDWPLVRPPDSSPSPAVVSMRCALEQCPVQRRAFEDPVHPGTLLVDAWLGTGFRVPLASPLDQWIPALGYRPDLACVGKIALDLPSGLECDASVARGPYVAAERTYSFAGRKTALEAGLGGAVRQIGLGIPEAVYRAVLAGQ